MFADPMVAPLLGEGLSWKKGVRGQTLAGSDRGRQATHPIWAPPSHKMWLSSGYDGGRERSERGKGLNL